MQPISENMLFSITARPEADLFYSRQDPMDPRMGEIVSADRADYSASQIVILGCPQDEGVRRNCGRTGAHLAPFRIRNFLYKLPAHCHHASCGVFDLGDIKNGSDLEETHQRVFQAVYRLLKDDKKVIVFGGGNDISFPDCSALSSCYGNCIAFNIDRHFDIRSDVPRNSGTPYYQLLSKGFLHAEQLYEIGFDEIVNSSVYFQQARNLGIHLYSIDELRKKGVDDLFATLLHTSRADAIFWGLDMDVVRSADAPGVSASYPGGLFAEEMCAIARIAGQDPRSRLFEITEVNPKFDIDDRTSKLAAWLSCNFIHARTALEKTSEPAQAAKTLQENSLPVSYRQRD